MCYIWQNLLAKLDQHQLSDLSLSRHVIKTFTFYVNREIDINLLISQLKLSVQWQCLRPFRSLWRGTTSWEAGQWSCLIIFRTFILLNNEQLFCNTVKFSFITLRYAPPPATTTGPPSSPTTIPSASPSPPASTTGPPPSLTTTSPPSSSPSSPPAQTKKTFVSMAVPRPKNGIINTAVGFIMLPESSDNGVSEETIETVPKKQRRMAERRKAPIVAKHETRNRKINLTSFKQKYLTLKRKVSAFMDCRIACVYNSWPRGPRMCKKSHLVENLDP